MCNLKLIIIYFGLFIAKKNL